MGSCGAAARQPPVPVSPRQADEDRFIQPLPPRSPPRSPQTRGIERQTTDEDRFIRPLPPRSPPRSPQPAPRITVPGDPAGADVGGGRPPALTLPRTSSEEREVLSNTFQSMGTCIDDDTDLLDGSMVVVSPRAVARAAAGVPGVAHSGDGWVPPRDAAGSPRRLDAGLAAGCAPPPGGRCDAVNVGRWALADAAGAAHLSRGGARFCFSCTPGCELGAEVKDIVAGVLRIVSPDIPPLCDMAQVPAAHLFIVSKAAYVLPGLDPRDLTVEFLVSHAYQKACCADSTAIDGSVRAPDMYRLTKTIVPLVFSVTMQFRVRELPPGALRDLAPLADGCALDRAFIFERVKRSGAPPNDGRDLRQVYLYQALGGGGAAVWQLSVTVSASLPAVAARLLDRLGQRGADDLAQIVQRTRKYVASGAAKEFNSSFALRVGDA